MLIQIISATDEVLSFENLAWFKSICNTWAKEYELEELSWFHEPEMVKGCDVYFKLNNPTHVLIGYIDRSEDFIGDLNKNVQWVEIELIESSELDPITQVLLATIGICYMPSTTGSFSVDWYDVRTVLSKGDSGYCYLHDWKSLHTILYPENAIGIMDTFKVHGSVMLLNEAIGMNESFNNAQALIKTKAFSKDGLEILNITSHDEIPSINVFLFVGDIAVNKHLKHIMGNYLDKNMPMSISLH